MHIHTIIKSIISLLLRELLCRLYKFTSNRSVSVKLYKLIITVKYRNNLPNTTRRAVPRKVLLETRISQTTDPVSFSSAFVTIKLHPPQSHNHNVFISDIDTLEFIENSLSICPRCVFVPNHPHTVS